VPDLVLYPSDALHGTHSRREEISTPTPDTEHFRAGFPLSVHQQHPSARPAAAWTPDGHQDAEARRCRRHAHTHPGSNHRQGPGALRAGAGGFLFKDVLAADLLAAVKVVAGGEALLSPKITRRFIDHFTQHAPTDPRSEQLVAALTPRETELRLAVARGLTNAEISASHHISLSTTKTHVGSLLAKLGAQDRVQLTIAAYEAGLMRR
jgi:DNA-binding CsgD family transcriptional regulator